MVASKFFIPFKSSHSTRQKKLMLVNEAERRLMNTSPDLPWSEFQSVLTKMSHKMRRSGYPASWRRETFRTAIMRYRRRKKEDLDGIRPLYRPREWMEEDRRLAKARKKQSWAKKHARMDELARAPLIISPSAG